MDSEPPSASEPVVYRYDARGARAVPHGSAVAGTSLRIPILSALIAGILVGMLVLQLLLSSSLPGMVSLRRGLGLNGQAGAGGPLIQQNLTVEESSAVISAAKKISPAVVSVTASQQVANFFGQVRSQEVAGGSGFIISSDGLIMTNKHVVSEAGASYKVVLNDGRIFDAKIQSTDTLNDLAVLKIQASGLPTVELGSSDSLQVGEEVLAVGNALGQFQNSVTSGIVSAKQRSIAPQSDSGGTEQLTGLVQTDASINPGNSGGPLVNLSGQVVGIDTAIASPSGGSIGIGFAIPIDDVKPVIAAVLKTGQITRPYLGVRYLPVDQSIKQLDALPVDYGALVSAGQAPGEPAVLPGSPADKAGLRENDIILSINGEKIDQSTSLQRLLSKYQVGDTITLQVQRGAQQLELKAVLGQQG